MQDVVMAHPPGADAYALHKAVYDRFAPPGAPRSFLFAPVSLGGRDAVVVRGDFSGLSLPPGVAKDLPAAAAGDEFSFTLRANPTVKCNGKRGQIGLSPEKDGLRMRWLRNRAAEHGFEVVEASVATEAVRIARPPTPFVLNVSTYSGVLRVLDPTRFRRALEGGVGRAEAWGCALLIVSPLRRSA